MRRLWPRRQVLRTGLGLALVPFGAAARAGGLAPTPAQTAGPYYPPDWSGETDNDLTRLAGASGLAVGEIVTLTGRVLRTDGAAVARARVEIWQCDALGRYHHPRAGGPAGRDPGFQGFGATATDAAGAYAFTTIHPVAYAGRTPHIHVAVAAPDGRTLVTQAYVAGEPANADDPIFRGAGSPEQRARLLVAYDDAPGGGRAGRFDIVLA